MKTSSSREPVYRFRVTSPGMFDEREFATEAEAQALVNAMRDRDFARYPKLEVLRFEKVGRGTREWLKRDGEWINSYYVGRGLTREEIAVLEAEAERKRALGPETFIGTFRRSNFHPNTGQCLQYGLVELKAASVSDANEIMWEAFGDDGWYDAIALDNFRPYCETGSIYKAPYYRVSWPTPPAPPGVTVTLRVVLTREQAVKPDLWIQGRCLLHRPATVELALPGAGVTTEGNRVVDALRVERTEGVGYAGLVLRVRFFRREDAERAVAADPEHVSIVPGTESLGTFRHPAKVFKDEPESYKSKVRLTGAFDLDALYAIAKAVPSFMPTYKLAEAAWDAVGEEESRIELEDNRVVAVHLVPPEAYSE